MTRLAPLLILIATTSELLACTAAAPTPMPPQAPSATLDRTQTIAPTAAFTPTVSPTVTAPPPTPTATRTQLPAPTRAPTTATFTPVPLPAVEWDARLDGLGIRVESPKVQPGQLSWRLIKAEFWDEKENQGKHHIFVNVLDEKGVRIIGQEISVEWPGEKLVILTENKPPPEYSANFPLDVNHYPPWGTLGAFDVRVNGLPSDKVIGMGLPPKNKFVVYLLTFQRTIGGR
jgi:hypothetical protein